ncbi:MAG: sigma-70 family RNA polymerase sigma factor [Phycisphaerales bacterium]
MTTTTALLGVLVQSADEDAWEEFVDRYRPIIVAIGLRLGLPEADAVDVAQQTLLEFVRDLRAGKYDRTKGRLRNWLLCIAEHRVRDHQRIAARYERLAPLASASGVIDSERLEEAWCVEERRLILVEALRRLRGQTLLDERTIRAFELTALRSVPAEVVAKECAMTTAQVYVARNRALTKLREIVRELETAYADEESA